MCTRDGRSVGNNETMGPCESVWTPECLEFGGCFIRLLLRAPMTAMLSQATMPVLIGMSVSWLLCFVLLSVMCIRDMLRMDGRAEEQHYHHTHTAKHSDVPVDEPLDPAAEYLQMLDDAPYAPPSCISPPHTAQYPSRPLSVRDGFGYD